MMGLSHPLLHVRAIGGSETEAGRVWLTTWHGENTSNWFGYAYRINCYRICLSKMMLAIWWMRNLGSRGRTCPALRMLVVFNN